MRPQCVYQENLQHTINLQFGAQGIRFTIFRSDFELPRWLESDQLGLVDRETKNQIEMVSNRFVIHYDSSLETTGSSVYKSNEINASEYQQLVIVVVINQQLVLFNLAII